MKLQLTKTTLIALFVACSQLALAQTVLPAAAKNCISTYFPKETISSSKMDDGNYEVHLSSGYELEFTKSGKIREIEGNGSQLPKSVIPAKILTYVNQKYAGKSIRKIELESYGYEISLGDDLELKFDRSGNFKKLDD